jgi:hypothetical protein
MGGLVANASAGQKNRNRDQNNDNNNNSSSNDRSLQKYTQKLGLDFSSDRGVANFKKHGHKHDDHPRPIDPGRGDGRVPVKPVTPQGPPGFVFVDGHWEREKAPQKPIMIVDPIPGSVGPVLRDHRTTGKPIVRDHRTTSGPVVRDHRQGSPQGGVSVTTTSDGNIRDHRTVTPKPTVRDHR